MARRAHAQAPDGAPQVQVREKTKPKRWSRFSQKTASVRAVQVAADVERVAWETATGLLAGKYVPFLNHV